MTHFTFPESYRAYLKDPAVQSAVEHILGSRKLEVPGDLEWVRLPDFHAAVLAAHQVRSDYATAMHDLWKKVWQPALADCGFADSLKPLSFNDQQKYSTCDTYSVWDGGLERVYDKDGHKLGLGVTSDFKQAWLTMWLLDGNDEDQTTSMDLEDAWDSEDGGYISSREKPELTSDGGIALDPLNRPARQALQEIGRILGIPKE